MSGMVLFLFSFIILQAAFAFAQQSYGAQPSAQPFEYHGCASVNLASFGDAITFSDGVLNAERCQSACKGYSIAALFSSACRCGDDAQAFEPLDSSSCDNPCMGDPSQGMCGSLCPRRGPEISTIYMISDAQAPDPKAGDPPLDAPPNSSSQSSYISSASSMATVTSSNGPGTASAPQHDAGEQSTALPTSLLPDVTLISKSTFSLSDAPSSEATPSIINEPGPDGVTTKPGSGFRPAHVNSTAPTGQEPGDPPGPSQVPKSRADLIRGYSISVMGGIAILVATVFD